MTAVADGTGYGLARVVREALKGKQTLNMIPSFKEPNARGDLAIRPAGAINPEPEDNATRPMTFALVEEQVTIRVAVADGDDDDEPISLLSIAAEVSRAVHRAGYVNFTYEFEALAQAQSGEKLLYVGGLVVAAQVSAHLS